MYRGEIEMNLVKLSTIDNKDAYVNPAQITGLIEDPDENVICVYMSDGECYYTKANLDTMCQIMKELV